jgi:hypothetical protein
MPQNKYRYRSWTNPRTQVRPSPIQGWGVFAREPILAGEVAEIIGGTVMTQAQFEAFLATETHYNAVQIAEDMYLIERPKVTEVRCGSLNHSCDSNLWMADEATVVARRDKATDEELTLDYALHTANPGWELDGPCNCGSPLCRGTVRGSDWKLPELQDRYRGHFSPFINVRIARIEGHEDYPGPSRHGWATSGCGRCPSPLRGTWTKRVIASCERR